MDDLNKILDDSGSRVEPSHEPSIAVGDPITHSDFDTMTLQDILNRADTTFVCPEGVTGASGASETPETHPSMTTANQSRLPSLSKEIIGMLIDIDNANYGKKDEEEEPSMVIERDPRLSDTLISSHPPARQSVSSTADNTLDLSTVPKHAYEETITPNTCFDNYSSEELMALCAKYKKLVIEGNRSEDVGVLLNINSVLFATLSDLLGHLEEAGGAVQARVRGVTARAGNGARRVVGGGAA